METVWEKAFDEATNPHEEIQEKIETVEFSPLSHDFLTLLEIGKLEDEIDISGRKIVIRTLKIGEELEIGLLVRDFQGSSEALRAEITAIVAAAIVSVDGRPLVTFLGPNENSLRHKFDYVRNNFYWPVVRLIFEHYNTLIERSAQALEEFEEKKD